MTQIRQTTAYSDDAIRKPHEAQTPEQQADGIEQRSPEGRPADPTVRAPGMIAWLLLAVAGVVIGAIIVGATQGLAAGIAVLIMGLGLAVFVNTEVWASILRARERRQMDHEIDHPAVPAFPRHQR
jgi:hypothetical protein